MSTFSDEDHAALKEFEHRGWDKAAVEYHRLWGILSVQTVDRMLDAVAVGPGCRVLDVATGAGYAAAAAANRGAEATGLDFSRAQVDLARREYPTVQFDEGDMEDLPYPADSFDAVVMNFGLLHSLRPARVASEAFRVLKSGGRFAYTVWALPEVAEGFRIVLGAIEKHGTMDVPLPPAQPYFRFSEKQESFNLLSRFGFSDLHFEIVPLVWRLPSAEQMFQAYYQGAVRATVILRNQSKEAIDAIYPQVIKECEVFQTDEGVEIPMGAALTVGTKP